jgi:protocatechuate 4,5-dioxygenase alpha chain
MAWTKKDYDDIPGTFVFDGRRSQMGWPLNKMCMSFNAQANRDAFKNDVDGYCRTYDLTVDQTQAVKDMDALRLLELGGSIYYLAKLAGIYGLNMQDLGAQMRGISVDEFKEMLLAQGREEV